MKTARAIIIFCVTGLVVLGTIYGVARTGDQPTPKISSDDVPTGAVPTHGTAPGPQASQDQVAPFIDADEAIDAALEVVPEGTIEGIELENEAGVLVWAIKVLDHVGVEHDVVVDATTSTILSNEVDLDAGDDDGDGTTG